MLGLNIGLGLTSYCVQKTKGSLTGPAVTCAEIALRMNSRTTSDVTRDPTIARIPVRNQN